MLVGYYVHHAGAGHRTRARVIKGALARRGHETVLLGSALGRHDGVDLPRDDTGSHFADPTAQGALHWAPVGHSGYTDRMGALAAWVTTRRPAVMVVDVSVEVAAFVRLLGVPVVVVAQPGDRVDEPHRLAYRSATAVLAPWPAAARPAPALAEFANKVHTVGGISRFGSTDSPADGPVLVLGGLAGMSLPAAARAWRDDVVEAGGSHWRDDLDTVLPTASLVVGHVGQNSVADVAATRRPFLMLPQDRAFREQHMMAAELDRLELAVPWPADPADLADATRSARRRVAGWTRWCTDGAADRAAAVIEEVGRG